MWYKIDRHFGVIFVSISAPILHSKSTQNGTEFRQKASLGYFEAILQYVDDIVAHLGARCGHLGSILDTILPKLMQFSRV